MTTSYPTNIDSYVTLYDNTTTIMAVYINDVQDAVEALQAKIGTNTATNTMNYKIDNFFTSGRKCWFFADTAPLRWTMVSGVGDHWLGLKGGSTYTTGGQTAGEETIGGSQHGIDWQWSTEWHVHRTFEYNAPYSYSYDQWGILKNTNTAGTKAAGVACTIGKGDPRLGKFNNASEAGYTQYNEHYHTHSGNWRPTAAVGILAEYTG